MIFRKLNIHGWIVYFWVCVEKLDPYPILDILSKLDCPNSLLLRINKNLSIDNINSAFTYSNNKCSVVFINKTVDGKEFFNSFCHELRHIVNDYVCYYNLDFKSEQAAYFNGDLCGQLADIVCKLSCNCCRNNM